MSFQKDAKEALRIAGNFSVQDFYPATFPDDVPTIELEKLSLSRLLNGDKAESERLFNTCTTVGFFYLDMLDHAIGRQLWRSACNLHQLGQRRFSSTPMEEKLRYKSLGGIRVFDRGYLVRNADQKGRPADMEILNVPQSEFFGTKVEGGGIPTWLSEQDQDIFKEALECGNTIARALLSVLEKQLQLPIGSITKLHRLNDDSGDFIRVLKYGGVPSDTGNFAEGFPPHRDAMSIAILFAWLGGLQIPVPNVEVQGFAVKDEDWRWVRPIPGYATVNLGDAMAIFTNRLLKSSIHRVIKAPGLQRPHDRYSIVVATRPENNSLMKAFKSPIIPPGKQDVEPMTSLEWGYSVVSGIQSRAVARGARDLDNA